MRNVGKLEEATNLYREVANAKADPYIATCAQWQLSMMRLGAVGEGSPRRDPQATRGHGSAAGDFAMSQADDARILTTAYREECELYRRALALAEAAEGGDAEWPRRLNDVLRLVDAIENRIAPVRERWKAGKTSDPAVNSVVAELTGLIADLRTIVAMATRRVEKRREELMPKMVPVVNADRGRQAYRRTERFGSPRDRRLG